ncbi:hypothetical protein [Kitasatospora camelliae]|uniref:Tetratricopeptide repeat protein n=1 Tax=Kitasatospora camelliae TaxID=3156397 RepID=A0AAU8JMJ2_9ACTN
MVRTEEPGAAVSAPSCLVGTDLGALSPAQAAAARRIGEAAAGGDLAEAGRLAAELDQRVRAARGASHPEALAVQEIRAYLAHLAGDHQGAAELYERTAAGWAAIGVASVWPATVNARACRTLGEHAGAWAAIGAASVWPATVNARACRTLAERAAVADGPTRRPRAAAPRSGRVARRGVVVAVAASVVLAWGTAELAMEHGAVVERWEMAAPVLHVPAQAPAAASADVPSPEPIPAPPPGPPSDQEREPEAVAPAGPSGRSALPARPRPLRAAAKTSPARPAPVQQRPPSRPQQVVPVDVCGRSGKAGLPPSLVTMCRRTYGR